VAHWRLGSRRWGAISSSRGNLGERRSLRSLGLPSVRRVPVSVVAEVVKHSGRKLAVLDDDPTGTQTVTGVPVLLRWDVEDLRWGLSQRPRLVYVVSNSRNCSPAEAAKRNRQIVEALCEAAGPGESKVVLASRSDSTLRGHFPLETDVLSATIKERTGRETDGVIMVPAFIEAGRITVDSVHYLRDKRGLLGVGQTEFANDATFGFRSSDLRAYVEEKSGGRWRASDVRRVTLWDLRERGPEAVAEMLRALRHGAPMVVDAVTDDDLRILALAIENAEDKGSRFVYRVGPSFVRARVGMRAAGPMTPRALARLEKDAAVERGAHGLVVAGSHVAQTTRQLETLSRMEGVARIVVNVQELVGRGWAGRRREAVASSVAAQLGRRDVVLMTSREVLRGTSPATSLAIGQEVSERLASIVSQVCQDVVPRWVLAKGGVTSSDVATYGLGIARAWARGTIFRGTVSVWEPVEARVRVPYVVFPGNVGDDGALARAVRILRGERGCS